MVVLIWKQVGVPTGSTRPLFDVIISPQGGHGSRHL